MCEFLSIIIPVFNAESYIYQCLKSVLNQTYCDFEVIIIDDGSSDNSRSIIHKFMQYDDRIKYFYQQNKGPSEARNYALKLVKGEQVLFLDADDYIEKNMLELLMSRSKENDLVLCDYFFETKYYREYRRILDNDVPNIQEIQKLLLTGDSFNSLWHKLFKIKIIHENKIMFNPHLRVGEDQIFIMEYLTYVKRIAYIPIALYHYRMIESSTCRSIHSNHLNMLVEQHSLRNNIIREFWKKDDDFLALSSVWFLHNIVLYYYLCCVSFTFKESRKLIKESLKNKLIIESLNKYKKNDVSKNCELIFKVFIPLIKLRNATLIILIAKLYKKSSDVKVYLRKKMS